MSDRKAELERKKAKLLAMREEKKKREEIKKIGIHDVEVSDIRQTTDELLKDLGLPEPVLPQASSIRELESPSIDTVDGILQRNSKKRKNLQISDVFEIAIPPPETIIYSKETQTLEEPQERETGRSTDYYVLTYDEGNRDEVDANAALAELEKMPHIGVTKTGQSRGILDKLDGIRTSTDGVDENTSNDVQRNDSLMNCVSNEFFDERWSKHRTITGLDWSTIFPELLLTAYHMNEEAVHEPEGVCLMWNMKYPKKLTPEFIFHCQSPVTSASLSRFHPNIVVGGTYSGQIVLWDSRVNKRTPVQRSPLTSWAHTHPVFAITLIGTQNAHNIISLGSDGSLCAWSLEMLAQPREKSKVCEMSSGGLFDLYPTCMSFFANDVNNYAVGAENGNAYCGQRHSSRTGVAEETSRHVPYKGHGAPLTAISTHPSPGAFSFSSLFLTASLDWTVRLWSTREHKPIHTFDDYSDYVYDVCWSPVHPAVFSAVDGTGNLDIWDMNQDAEIPVARRKLGLSSNVDTSSSSSSNLVGVALNKCRWNTAGTHVAVGDDTGRVTVCSVHESLSQPVTDDWSSFAHVLADLKHYEMEPEVETEA
ncbi:LOW QUALITY PROTEIN: cytoplasmic dynein intermediate chain 2, (dhic-2), putative [Schistosoma mansoni]|uniref:cytoplasmic dynein intermediate chain 2, (dhic-2), putative n=1 Tax=Schistosoma mansoni TaxID=6183 RepID=UPI00022C851C|nr:LOW QUALITY PROTEIN: cytoplasmic dynein intermediate chain 2, (dhic-2), putative [Schistosoma mansoni]|eukprot:XP_018646951.1 LOW QUALITY PROTEIN: cytoplasmic dynein intermediate chain 2, (dhic-2), putative [Schistosoma mansoni]